MSARLTFLGFVLFLALVLTPFDGNAPGLRDAIAPKFRTSATPRSSVKEARFKTSGQKSNRTQTAAPTTSRKIASTTARKIAPTNMTALGGEFEPVEQLERLGALSTEVQALDQANKAALQELKDAQIELDRRSAAAKVERQILESSRRRDILRQAVQRQFAQEKRRQARQAQTAARMLVKRKAAQMAALVIAREAAAQQKAQHLIKAQQLAKEKEKRAAAQAAQLAAEREARRLGVELARMRRAQNSQARTLQLNKTQIGDTSDVATLPAASAGRLENSVQTARAQIARANLQISNGKAAGPSQWIKGELQTERRLQPKPAAGARLQRNDAVLTAALAVQETRDVERTNKWIEAHSADETARGDTPVIWNLRSEGTISFDRNLGADGPQVFKAFDGRFALRRLPGELIGKKLVLELQRELRRAGCQPGRVDGKWGRKGQRALDRFMARAKVSLDEDGPSLAALEVIQAARQRWCRTCGGEDILRGRKCLEKRRVRRAGNRGRRVQRNDKTAAAIKKSAKIAKAAAKAEADAKWVREIFGGSP